MPDRVPDGMSKYMSDRLANRMPQYLYTMVQYMPNRMPQDMADRTLDYMQSRMSKYMCYK